MFTTINYEYADLFLKDKADKKLMIVSDDRLINISSTELHQQQFELTESLCSENELRFGSCEPSMIKFTVNNVFIDMTGKWLTITMIVEGHTDKPFQIGRYKVFSDTASADRTKRDVVAYDKMYNIINADASSMARWYNEVLPNTDSTITLREFRTRFISYFDLEQVLPQGGLVNDDMIVEKTIEPEQISGKDIITAICEINGCFGHIGRNGKFYYIYLPQEIEGLYPSNVLYPANDLFPRDPKSTNVGNKGSYIDIAWEDFVVESINKIQIRQEENDIGKIYPDTPTSDSDNSYIIQDNFLVYGKSSEELLPIARNVLEKITAITYRPVTGSDFKGNPCLEVGDPIRVGTKYELVETYILERTLKGIQALRDSYLAKGVKKRTEQVNGVHSSIMRLKGKTNILTRTIEETRSEIKDMGSGLETKILQTAKQIELEAKRAIDAEVELAAAIKITADNITAEVSRATNAEEALQNDYTAKIKLTVDQLSTEITEKTQVWDTGDYTINYEGVGEPQIPVSYGEYYLDTKTGAIYVGVRSNPREGWYLVAEYKYDNSTDIYNRFYHIDGYGAPKVLKKPLDQYGYVDKDNPPAVGSEGDVWLSSLTEEWQRVQYHVYALAHPAEWKIVGYAEIETLPQMSSKITQTAKSIELKVSKGDVTSQLLIESTDIYLKTGRLRIETDNLEINKDGSSGEILSRNLSQSGVTSETARYIKLNAGGLEGGYGNTTKCKIECSNSGLAFRGARMTFCMDNIYVGTSMNTTKTNKAYTGDIAYVAPQGGDVTKLNAAVMHVWNGLVLDNSSYS